MEITIKENLAGAIDLAKLIAEDRERFHLVKNFNLRINPDDVVLMIELIDESHEEVMTIIINTLLGLETFKPKPEIHKNRFHIILVNEDGEEVHFNNINDIQTKAPLHLLNVEGYWVHSITSEEINSEIGTSSSSGDIGELLRISSKRILDIYSDDEEQQSMLIKTTSSTSGVRELCINGTPMKKFEKAACEALSVGMFKALKYSDIDMLWISGYLNGLLEDSHIPLFLQICGRVDTVDIQGVFSGGPVHMPKQSAIYTHDEDSSEMIQMIKLDRINGPIRTIYTFRPDYGAKTYKIRVDMVNKASSFSLEFPMILIPFISHMLTQ